VVVEDEVVVEETGVLAEDDVVGAVENLRRFKILSTWDQ
jgi:hypothetical protein